LGIDSHYFDGLGLAGLLGGYKTPLGSA
jgi:hypothetical protein